MFAVVAVVAGGDDADNDGDDGDDDDDDDDDFFLLCCFCLLLLFAGFAFVRCFCLLALLLFVRSGVVIYRWEFGLCLLTSPWLQRLSRSGSSALAQAFWLKDRSA